MFNDRMAEAEKERGAFVASGDHSKADTAQAVLIKGGRRVAPALILDEAQAIWQGDTLDFLSRLPAEPIFDLVVTSPPYNIGKSYEVRKKLNAYLEEQAAIIDQIVPRLKVGGSVCWQVGTFIEHNEVFPLDIEFAPLFRKHGLRMRNRIVWAFGHGLHSQKRFSGRYETILWFTNTPNRDDSYTFNLDAVRVPAKYPGKRHSKGPNAGKLSGHPLGKNPEDVWDNIPNVKNNHIEKTEHPCQFPVGLVERLVLALTNKGDLVFDPFAGVASAGVAATVHERRFWGCELVAKYAQAGVRRIQAALNGEAVYRPHDKPVFDHTKSPLSKLPEGVEHSRHVTEKAAAGEGTE
ncbi:DNA-methyltransferase [Achromobacter xylosoxidans]|uniref:DNA-methyltransferase n=1 Tax=Alcaligenes xylosoxydans xylosoxydans TaxID=85698 RepID=UPI002E18FB05|nr:DNA methyltransferase [Achromobacter xylosoxidans]MEC6411161.1 DNA methyltransferase [Achromobacter xylosoxidans]